MHSCRRWRIAGDFSGKSADVFAVIYGKHHAPAQAFDEGGAHCPPCLRFTAPFACLHTGVSFCRGGMQAKAGLIRVVAAPGGKFPRDCGGINPRHLSFVLQPVRRCMIFIPEKTEVTLTFSADEETDAATIALNDVAVRPCFDEK